MTIRIAMWSGPRNISTAMMRSFGAREVPYEMNTTLFSALKGTIDGKDEFQIDRFIASQTIMMSVEGIPAFYVQSFSLIYHLAYNDNLLVLFFFF